MVPRTDGQPFVLQAQVNASLCTSCGICMGSCPSSTPFRRSKELRTGIDLPDYRLKDLRERTIAAAQALTGTARVLVFACDHGGARDFDGVVRLPCVAMVPPSLFDFVLSRGLADGLAIAGCAESACYNRLGVAWTEQRIAGQRDPYLRARVPRERILTVWASVFSRRRVAAQIETFRTKLLGLPARSSPPSSTAAKSASAAPRASIETERVP